MFARGNVAAAHLVQAKCGDEIGGAVDRQDARDASPVVDETDEGTGHQHSTLHADQHGGVRAGELIRRNHFLHQRVDRGPVHRGTRAGDEGHEIEMPETEVAAPGNVGDGEHGDAAAEVEHDAEVAAIVAIDEHASDEGDEQAGKRYDDHLHADGDGRVGGGQDV